MYQEDKSKVLPYCWAGVLEGLLGQKGLLLISG